MTKQMSDSVEESGNPLLLEFAALKLELQSIRDFLDAHSTYFYRSSLHKAGERYVFLRNHIIYIEKNRTKIEHDDHVLYGSDKIPVITLEKSLHLWEKVQQDCKAFLLGVCGGQTDTEQMRKWMFTHSKKLRSPGVGDKIREYLFAEISDESVRQDDPLRFSIEDFYVDSVDFEGIMAWDWYNKQYSLKLEKLNKCRECGKIFFGYRTDQLYCSYDCSSAFVLRKIKEDPEKYGIRKAQWRKSQKKWREKNK